MTKAYSYLRFSTPEQSRGDSFRRQTDMAARYAAANGLVLDEALTFRDLGVSAFRGTNAETGALGVFLRAVEAGDVAPGSVLLVEALDRISRQKARKALRVLEDIVEAGVDLVTLSDGKRYTKESLDGFDLLMALLLLIRGNEESQTKSRRLKAAWVGKRGKAGDQVLTRLTVGWINVDDGGRAELIPERAKIVKRIFDQFLAGKGRESIAAALNAEHVPTFGRVGQPNRRAKYWHGSYIIKILRNPATYGVMIPHTTEHDEDSGRVRRVPLDPVHDYYPAVIDREMFERAQALLVRGAPRGRHASGKMQSLLSRLAHCPRCDGTMTRVSKGANKKAGPPYLVCAKAKAGAGCEYHAIRMNVIESAIRHNAKDLPRLSPHANVSLQAEISAVADELYHVSVKVESLIDELAIRPSSAIRQRLVKLEEQQEALRKERDALASKAMQTDSKLVKRRVERLKAALSAKVFEVQELNTALRECFERVTVDYVKGVLRFAWRQGGETELPFASSKVWGSPKSKAA